MAALLVLESMIRPEFLKPQWRPFAQPAPHPDDTSECLIACRGCRCWLWWSAGAGDEGRLLAVPG